MSLGQAMLAFVPPHFGLLLTVHVAVEAYAQQLVTAISLALKGKIDSLHDQQGRLILHFSTDTLSILAG